MHIYMYICIMHICVVYKYVSIWLCIVPRSLQSIFFVAGIYLNIYKCVYVLCIIYACIYVYIHIFIYMYIYVYTYISL